MKPHSVFMSRKFFCRKGMHAIPLQAVLSSDYKFLYMSEMCAASTNDCIAFSVSGLACRLRTIGLAVRYWIAGDAAYDARDGIIVTWSRGALQCLNGGIARLIQLSPLKRPRSRRAKLWYPIRALWYIVATAAHGPEQSSAGSLCVYAHSQLLH